CAGVQAQPPLDSTAYSGSDARDARQAAVRSAIGLLLDQFDLAALFDVSLEQLRKWRQHAQAPRYTRIARRPYYRADDIRDWIASLPLEGPQQPVKQQAKAR